MVFTVKYKRLGVEREYVHTHEQHLSEAVGTAERWKAGNGWGGWPADELVVFVENAEGAVVHIAREMSHV